MEWSKVDFPDPFSPVSMISGCERSTIMGRWELRLVKTGWARIFSYMKLQDNRRAADHRRCGLPGKRRLGFSGGAAAPGGPRRDSRASASRRRTAALVFYELGAFYLNRIVLAF